MIFYHYFIGLVKIPCFNYSSDKNCMHKAFSIIFCTNEQWVLLHLCCSKL